VYSYVDGVRVVVGRVSRRRPPLASAPVATPPALPPWDDGRLPDADEMVVISYNWDKLRRFIWDYVGFNWNLNPITPDTTLTQSILRPTGGDIA
jgi:hypothetical protein